MSFTLHENGWYAWQMLPGNSGDRCVPYFFPVLVRRVKPLKTGKGKIEVDLYNAFYAEGVQEFTGLRLRILERADNFLVVKLIEAGPSRVVVLSHIEFAWLEQFCPGVMKTFPPVEMDPLYQGSVSLYLGSVFLQNPKPQESEYLDSGAESRWLTNCALRFDGYRYAKDHNLGSGPHEIVETFVARPTKGTDPDLLMAVMFMLQRCLMKERVRSKKSQAWKLFRELFLRLAPLPVPEAYSMADYAEEWRTEFEPLLPAGEGLIRKLHQGTVYESTLL